MVLESRLLDFARSVGQNGTLYFKGRYDDGIVMTFCDMEMLHRHTKYVFN